MNIIKTLALSLFALLILTFNSCKKDSGTVVLSNSFSATIDGTPTVFTNALIFTNTVNNQTVTVLEGTSDKTTLSITLNGAITAGKTYTTTASNANDRPVMLYVNTDDNYINDDTNTSNPVSVTVNTVSSSVISGVFTGNLSNSTTGNATHKTKSITNGKFYLSFSGAAHMM